MVNIVIKTNSFLIVLQYVKEDIELSCAHFEIEVEEYDRTYISSMDQCTGTENRTPELDVYI